VKRRRRIARRQRVTSAGEERNSKGGQAFCSPRWFERPDDP
jgi:hypothetical protein